MSSLASFLPPHLRLRLTSSGPPRRMPSTDRIAAGLLLSDISGFTALTERLQISGREGAEEIAATLGRAFAPAIRAIEARGGSIATFGGDALFAIFPGAGELPAHGPRPRRSRRPSPAATRSSRAQAP